MVAHAILTKSNNMTKIMGAKSFSFTLVNFNLGISHTHSNKFNIYNVWRLKNISSLKKHHNAQSFR